MLHFYDDDDESVSSRSSEDSFLSGSSSPTDVLYSSYDSGDPDAGDGYNISSHLAGPLLVPSLPTDAWEQWCKDGVVCFGMNRTERLKIYFANPKDLSVYHVIDFYSPKLNGLTVAFGMVGSIIYVVGGTYHRGGGPVDVYYCDVATQTGGTGGGYEWNKGPKLNSPKMTPYVFILDEKLYVLSACSKNPLEVLNSGSGNWEVLNGNWEALSGSPWEVPSDSRFPRKGRPNILGHLVVDDDTNKKVLIFTYVGFCIYDAKKNEWIQLKLRDGPENLTAELSDIFHMEINSLLHRSDSFVLATINIDFEDLVVKPLLGFDKGDLVGKPFERGHCFEDWHSWHLLPLGKGTGRFCIVDLYTDFDERAVHLRFSTFHLLFPDVRVQPGRKGKVKGKSKSKSKRLKLPGNKVVRESFKDVIISNEVLIPSEGCFRVGAFA